MVVVGVVQGKVVTQQGREGPTMTADLEKGRCVVQKAVVVAGNVNRLRQELQAVTLASRERLINMRLTPLYFKYLDRQMS